LQIFPKNTKTGNKTHKIKGTKMQSPQWEMFIAQRDSTTRYIVAYFDDAHCLVQMADVIAQEKDQGQLIHMEAVEKCTLDQAPDVLFNFFKTPNKGFSFKKDVHFNCLLRGETSASVVHCFHIKEEFTLDGFRSVFCKVVGLINARKRT
jgi:hypothetical protein